MRLGDLQLVLELALDRDVTGLFELVVLVVQDGEHHVLDQLALAAAAGAGLGATRGLVVVIATKDFATRSVTSNPRLTCKKTDV